MPVHTCAHRALCEWVLPVSLDPIAAISLSYLYLQVEVLEKQQREFSFDIALQDQAQSMDSPSGVKKRRLLLPSSLR